jgi:hypothetical protein
MASSAAITGSVTQLLIGAGSRRRSASQAIDLPSGGGVNIGRFFTDGDFRQGERKAKAAAKETKRAARQRKSG